MQTTHILINWRMNQETVVYEFTGIPFGNKKEPSAELENIKLRERRRVKKTTGCMVSIT